MRVSTFRPPVGSVLQASKTTWAKLGSGLGCVTGDCTGSYATAVDAAAGGIDVTGNFGIAGDQGSDNFARWTPPGA